VHVVIEHVIIHGFVTLQVVQHIPERFVKTRTILRLPGRFMEMAAAGGAIPFEVFHTSSNVFCSSAAKRAKASGPA
jgi:hypothetical protein